MVTLALPQTNSLAVSPASAAVGAWAENEQGRLRLISAPTALGTGKDLQLGLEFQLADGWKTYWRSPGDAGFPVSVTWEESENLAEAEMAWPVPKRFTLFGLDTFGYGKQVVFPLTVSTTDPGQPLTLRGQVNYLVCEEICIPHNETVSLTLPAGPPDNSEQAFLLDQFRDRVPDRVTAGETSSSGLTLDQVSLMEGAEGSLLLEATLRSALPLSDPDLLVEGPEGFRFGKPEVVMGTNAMTALLRLPVDKGPGAPESFPFGEEALLTLTDDKRGLEQLVSLDQGEPSMIIMALPGSGAVTDATGETEEPGSVTNGSDSADRGLLGFMVLALLGGLILNLMPCVLPVLSIKILSAIGHGGKEKGQVRLSFLASAAGIVASFLALALLAIGLKTAGMNVGWGIQFQQPFFLAAMALLVTFFACNLFGFFEVNLPGWLSSAAARGGMDKGLGGNFATGAFATLLATPCSAPFLGTAVGFALARGAVDILAIFAALGVGMALPYLLVALRPGLATRLPKPGPWMVTLRRVLGLALAGTAVWLLSVLWVQIGLVATLLLAAALLLLSVVFFLKHRERLSGPVAAWSVTVLMLLSFGLPGLSGTLLPAGPAASGTAAAQSKLQTWQALDQGEIDRLVGQGKVVFVDITADWCITCQVNKALVLDREPVASLLNDGEVVLMRGDWTSPDEKISAFLASYGRYGIPFNAVFGPQQPDGVLLPEFLTVEGTIAALDDADAGNRLAAIKP
ncbi:protein-disulfide reductase DsbD family protein [Rhodovibrionaceae bacterium A322]